MKAQLGDILTELETGFACNKSKLVTDGVPHLRPFNIAADMRLDLGEVYNVPRSEAPGKKIGLCEGDILFNNTNSPDLVGKIAYVEKSYAFGFSNHVTRLRINKNRALPAFVAWQLYSCWKQGQFRKKATQWVSQAAVNSSAVKAIELSLLPLDEQRRIVDILNRANGILRLRRQAQEKAQQLIPALFVKMFGDSANAQRPWNRVHFGSVYETKPNYGTMLKPTGNANSWLDIRVANIQQNALDLSDKKYVDLPDKDIARHSVQDGDLLLARAIGSFEHLGKCVIARPAQERWAFDSHIMRIRLNRSIALPEYVHAWLTSAEGRKEFLRYTRSTAVQFNINTKELSQIAFPTPPLALQQIFVARLAEIQSIIEQQNRMAAANERLIDSLMHRMFEGG